MIILHTICAIKGPDGATSNDLISQSPDGINLIVSNGNYAIVRIFTDDAGEDGFKTMESLDWNYVSTSEAADVFASGDSTNMANIFKTYDVSYGVGL